MSDFVVQASIGRNIGNEPMSKRDWKRFINDVSDALREQNETPEFHFGTGTWEGISEDSVHVTVFRNAGNLSDIGTLKATLSRIAARYGQDAIALTIGTSVLITR